MKKNINEILQQDLAIVSTSKTGNDQKDKKLVEYPQCATQS